jgi:hypothetical protein
LDMIRATKSFLEHYLGFFGDRKFQYVDLMPEIDEAAPDREHVDLGERFMHPHVTDEEIAAMDEYRHPCWCNPELIYADDKKGNEVWLHKRIQ